MLCVLRGPCVPLLQEARVFGYFLWFATPSIWFPVVNYSWRLLLCHFVYYVMGHTTDTAVHPKFHHCLPPLVQQRSLECVFQLLLLSV